MCENGDMNIVTEEQKAIEALYGAEAELGKALYNLEWERKKELTQKLSIVVAVGAIVAGLFLASINGAIDSICGVIFCPPLAISLGFIIGISIVALTVFITQAIFTTLNAIWTGDYFVMPSPEKFYEAHTEGNHIKSDLTTIQRSMAYEYSRFGLANRRLNDKRNKLFNIALVKLKSSFITALIFVFANLPGQIIRKNQESQDRRLQTKGVNAMYQEDKKGDQKEPQKVIRIVNPNELPKTKGEQLIQEGMIIDKSDKIELSE